MTKNYNKLVLLTALLAICVVALGAYTRLSDAGLGCPDWPGCYGFLTVPDQHHEISQAESNFPGMVVEHGKAWKEMIHRYVAGSLGLLILAIFLQAWRKRSFPAKPLRLPMFLVLLVVFQAALGMWTVTLNLQPLIVMGHLLGGFSIAALLSLLYLRLRAESIPGGDAGARKHTGLAMLALAVLIIQIALGGWLSANYAAPHCSGLPLCQDSGNFSLSSVFHLPRDHVSYEYGVLSQQARMSIHLLHRIWALVTCAIVIFALLRLWQASYSRKIKACIVTVALALCCQISLGLAVVHWQFPLSVALAHNLMALMLLLSMVRLCYYLKVKS